MMVQASRGNVDLEDLRTIMKDAVSRSKTWAELADILKMCTITLTPKGGGLMVVNAETGEEICKLSAIKFSYIKLIRHFGEGFPEHPQNWLEGRALSDTYVPKGAKRLKKSERRKMKLDGDDDITLIED